MQLTRFILCCLLSMASCLPGRAQDNPRAEFAKGQALMDQGDWDGAIAFYSDWVNKHPKRADPYALRGEAKLHKNDLDGALADFDRAIELDPKQAVTYLYRGALKERRGELEAAMADLNRAIELNPRNAFAYTVRAAAKGGQKNFAGALADFSRAVELDPADVSAYAGRGTARGALGGDDRAALADLNRAIDAGMKEPTIIGMRGLVKRRMGDLKGSLADYDEAIRLDPNERGYYQGRALTYYFSENWEQAHADLTAYATKQVLSAEGRFHACAVKIRMGQMEAARKALREALAKPPGAKPGWESKIAAFLLGDLDEAAFLAAANSGDAQAIAGQKCEAFYYAGILKLAAGKKDAAAQLFQQSVATEKSTFTEFMLAQAELKAMALSRRRSEPSK